MAWSLKPLESGNDLLFGTKPELLTFYISRFLQMSASPLPPSPRIMFDGIVDALLLRRDEQKVKAATTVVAVLSCWLVHLFVGILLVALRGRAVVGRVLCRAVDHVTAEKITADFEHFCDHTFFNHFTEKLTVFEKIFQYSRKALLSTSHSFTAQDMILNFSIAPLPSVTRLRREPWLGFTSYTVLNHFSRDGLRRCLLRCNSSVSFFVSCSASFTSSRERSGYPGAPIRDVHKPEPLRSRISWGRRVQERDVTLLALYRERMPSVLRCIVTSWCGV